MRLTTEQVLQMVATERRRQDAKWGVQEHTGCEWATIMAEELGEFSEASLAAMAMSAPLPQQIVEAAASDLAVRIGGRKPLTRMSALWLEILAAIGMALNEAAR